jgi:hypothetical protein
VLGGEGGGEDVLGGFYTAEFGGVVGVVGVNVVIFIIIVTVTILITITTNTILPTIT